MEKSAAPARLGYSNKQYIPHVFVSWSITVLKNTKYGYLQIEILRPDEPQLMKTRYCRYHDWFAKDPEELHHYIYRSAARVYVHQLFRWLRRHKLLMQILCRQISLLLKAPQQSWCQKTRLLPKINCKYEVTASQTFHKQNQ